LTSTSAQSPCVLLVEDDVEQLNFARLALEREGFQVTGVGDAHAAVKQLHAQDFDVVVSDLRLPGMSGVQFLRYVRLYRSDLPFVMLTGMNDVPTAVSSMRDGADEYLLKPVDPVTLRERLRTAIVQRAEKAAAGRQARQAETAGLIGFLRGVHALINSLEMKDQYTRDHSKKVAGVSMTMARELGGLGRKEIREIRVGALLHDVGKIGVPQAILHKNGPLTDAEWDLVKQHPLFGARILQPLAKNHPEVQKIVRHEHERWDGRGYPDGIAGEAIPLGARLIMIADTYDAICSTRPYRKALSKDHALQVMREGSGTQFDPALVPVFERVLAVLPEPRY